MLIIIESDAGPEPRASESNFIIIIFSLSEPTRTPEAESDDSCHQFSESRFSGKPDRPSMELHHLTRC